MTPANRVSLYQLVLALASLAALVYLGRTGVLSGDAVAGMIGAIVAYVTGQQAFAQQAASLPNGTPRLPPISEYRGSSSTPPLATPTPPAEGEERKVSP